MTERSGERREYPNPPIEEGLCQFTFAEPVKWNVATPGLLFEALQAEYPEIPEVQEPLRATMQVQPSTPGGTNVAFDRGPQRCVYKDNSGRRLLIASPSTLSVNSLRPYEGWSGLRRRLERGMGIVEEVTGLPPVSQVTLRYINIVSVPDQSMNSDDYFNISVRTAAGGQATFNAFLHRVDSMLPDDRTRVLSTFATVGHPSECRFLLDLELHRNGPNSNDHSVLMLMADELKVLENEEFESCITDKTRDLFK